MFRWDSIPDPLTSPSPQHSLHFSDGQTEGQNQLASWWQNLNQDTQLPANPPTRQEGERELCGYGVMKATEPLPRDGRLECILGEIIGITLFSRGKNNHGKRLQLQLITADCVTAV